MLRPEEPVHTGRVIHSTAAVCGVFAFLFWAGFILTALTGTFRPVSLVGVVPWTGTAWLALTGWRRWNISYSWAALAAMTGSVALSRWLLG